ncbi:beta-ketoacyl-ACP synthase III [Candidatus Oleimmundimicrobium sp.]|uniref:beta-ketoacyl-ACP synthase III n=1 Tax=Candidatus Oleimmundimicrobium sp. TaxID=3060597 RepID=UPI00271BA9CF|nr:beta-ketoacyl-ACP synthase III [Candidatus Oleimmundimicrobium sp.]MDO8885349.1 beta-ketoacyl-ACP synthase III [Candidatus Oleimmundimicrobium sp.]
MSVGIIGTGSYLPSKVLTNFDLEKIVDTSDEWIKTRTGISERRIIDDNANISDMAVEASKKALLDADLEVSDIDLIILATCSPETLMPSTSCLVQQKLGAKTIPAFDVSAGCTGLIYAITIGTQFIETGMYEKVLVIGADALSRHLDWTDRTTCVLFGDGAGAVILGKVQKGYGIISNYLAADGKGADLLKIPAGGSGLPATEDSFEKKLHCVQMSGSEVFKFATRALPRATKAALKRANLTIDDVKYIIPHQANIRILENVAKKFGVGFDKLIKNIDKYGNTSTASIAIALDELQRANKIHEGDILLLVGFGAGLTWGANVIKWVKYKKSK